MAMPYSADRITLPDSDVLYPSEDEEKVGETDFHMIALILLREGLQDSVGKQADVYVASDLFIYYEEGNPRARRAPDVMVVRGVGRHFRRVFKAWVEKALPFAVFEIASGSSWKEDLGEKRELYEQLGVPWYFIFDPEGECLRPVLQGYGLQGKHYVRLEPADDGSLTCPELGLRLRPEGHMLRLIDLATGKPILTREEQAKQERQAKNRARKQARTAQQALKRAEQEAQEAKQRLEAMRVEMARLKAERARQPRHQTPRRRGKKNP
jgi:Uma2 family endonuclease